MHRTLITAEELQALQRSGRPLMVFDCSFDLMAPQVGRAQFEQGHIPGAIHADLNTHLSAAEGDAPCSGGRHPLPSRAAFERWLGSVGFSNEMQAVVYDRQGSLHCGRLWWMLKWMGHEAVAVLDGGLQAWQASGGSLATGPAVVAPPARFSQGDPRMRLVSVQEVETQLGQDGPTVIDARAAARYRGEVEPLDPVAGHIPGALNRPYNLNMGPDGRFKPAAELRQEFEALLAGRDPARVVHQCGSGVSAVPNLLAMQIAGLGSTGLFAGSWSEWCSDPSRPVARG